MNQEKVEQLINLIDNYNIGLVAINSYSDRDNRVTVRRINVGFKYENVKKDDLATLIAGVEFIPSEKYTKADWDIAIIELKQSIIAPSKARSEGQTNAYVDITKKQTGVLEYNFETQELYIKGLNFNDSVKVIEEGTKKEVKSSPKTIAKNVIRKAYLKSGEIRRFKVHSIGELKLKGETLEMM